MLQDDIQRALQFLSLLYVLSERVTAEAIVQALEGPIALDDIPTSIPWPCAESVIRVHPNFLDKDPVRRVWWELRDAEPLNRIHLTKALVDASDNQTLDAVDLLDRELRGRPELVRRIADIASDLADVLSDADLPPKSKLQLVTDLLATA